MRYSHQRELIENIIKGRKDHPTADMIYISAREIEPNISLGTVYRNLKQLLEQDKIISLETIDKKVHYDGDVTGHAHFICTKCGNIVDFFPKIGAPKELTEMGHKVKEQKCIYYGLCSNCDKN